MSMYSGSVPASQQLAEKLIATGFAGMRFRSFVADSGSDDLNLVLWNWGPRRPAKVVLVDDEGRLVP